MLQAKATGKVHEESKVVLSGKGGIDGTGFLATANALHLDPRRAAIGARVAKETTEEHRQNNDARLLYIANAKRATVSATDYPSLGARAKSKVSKPYKDLDRASQMRLQNWETCPRPLEHWDTRPSLTSTCLTPVVRSPSSPLVSLTPLDSPGSPAGKGTSLEVGPEVDLCAWSLAALARADETLARARRFLDDSGYRSLAHGGHLLPRHASPSSWNRLGAPWLRMSGSELQKLG